MYIYDYTFIFLNNYILAELLNYIYLYIRVIISINILIYNSIDLEIKENKKSSFKRNDLPRTFKNPKQSKEFNNIYNNLFINYNSDTRFNYLDDQGSMLIVCFDDFIDEMESFVNWKNRKGIHTEIVGINSIGGSIDAFKNYINDSKISKTTFKNNILFLILTNYLASEYITLSQIFHFDKQLP